MSRTSWSYLALTAVAALCIAAFLLISLAAVFHPYDLDRFEGILFLPALYITSGQPIYGSDVMLREPFMFATYGPVYYALHGLLLKLTGVSFLPGRSISLAATAATSFMIYRAVRRDYPMTVGGIVAVAVFLMMPPAWIFGAIQRVDALGVFWAVLAVVVSFSSVKKRALFFAGGAAALAVLTKPTLVGAGVSVALCLLLTRRSKELGAFVAGGLCVSAAAALAFVLSGNGGYLFNLSSANLPFSPRWYIMNFRAITQGHTLFACAVVAAVAVVRFRSGEYRFSEKMSLTYLLVSGALGIITCGRVGGDVNYFYEPVAALALVVGFEFGKLGASSQGVLKTAASLLLIAALLTDLIVLHSGSFRGRVLLPARRAPMHAALLRNLALYVPAGGAIASDYQDLVLRSGHRVYFNDMAVYAVGSEAMRERFQSYLDDKKLAAIISYQRRSVPGYKLAGGEYTDPNSTSGQYYPGPLLYLREDLWLKYAESSGRESGVAEGAGR